MSDTGPTLRAVEATAPEHGTKAANEAALAALPARPLPTPGMRGPLERPTERPDEPVTAGLSTGPGPGPGPMPGLSPADQIRAIYRAHPTTELRTLVEFLNATGQ